MRHPVEIFVSLQAACMILPLWREGKNTLEIAQALGLPESTIANRLPQILEQSRMPKVMTVWSDDRMASLRKYYDEGYSCSQIAAFLGGTTRNAVIGKIHRLGMAGRGAGKHPPMDVRARSRREYPTPQPRHRPIRVQLSAKLSPEQAETLRCVEVEPRHLSLIDLEPNDCRWPYGDGPFTHCGHPHFAGSSYCPSHFFLSIGPGTSSERSAAKVSVVHLEPFA